MRRIADDGLADVTDSNFYLPIEVRDRAEIAGVAISADPDIRTGRLGTLYCVAREPFAEMHRVSSHVGVGRFQHFGVALAFKNSFSCRRIRVQLGQLRSPYRSKRMRWRQG